jgi:selenophosphate synthase
VAVASAPVATTEHPDAQFALLDYIELRRGDKDGYMPALSSFTQVTDITKEPDDDIHVKIAMTDAIERLNLLGCGNPALFKFFPIYDAPTEEMLDRIRINLDAFMSRYNLVMEDYSSLKRGKLFYGTSAISITNKELPTRYEQVEEGMEIMMTNKFGGLAAASLHALLSDPANADRFEKAGVPVAEITAARDAAIKSLSEPHFALGKIISKYCPDFGQAFDKNAHITAVYPVGPRGIFALGALAELANAGLAINDIPVRDGEISRLAANESLVENATASQHGCHVLVATKDVLNLVAEEMRQHHFAPETIGTVAKKGAPSVTIEKDAGQYVANKAKLARLLAPAS